MKKINVIITCGMLLLAAPALTGCSEEKYDVDGTNDNLVFVSPKEIRAPFECEVMTTPAGVFGRVGADINLRLQYPSTANVHVSARVNADQQLVSKYNAEHETEYQLPSADVLQAMKAASTNIEAGKTTGIVSVTLDESKIESFRSDGSEESPQYIIPVSIAYDGSDGKSDRKFGLSSEYNTTYVIVKTSKADDFTSVVGSKTISSNVVKNPVGTFGGISANVKIKNLIPVTGDMQGTFVVDNSLVGEYNSKNNTSYTSLPEEVLSALTITPAIVKEDNTESEDGIKVSCPDEIAQKLEGAYVLPLRLKTTFANGNAVDEDDIVYVTIEVKNSLINDNPSEMIGSDGDHSDWTCIEAVNFNKDSFTTYQWKPLAKNISEASYVVDFGAVHNVTGFQNVKASSWRSVITSYRIYISEDNTNWVDLGSTDGCNTVRDNNRNSWYMLYGAVKARYIKVEVTFDPNGYYWRYYDYSWGASYVGVNTSFAFND